MAFTRIPAGTGSPSPQEQAALQLVVDKLAEVGPGACEFVLNAITPPAPDSRLDQANKALLRDAYDYSGHLIYAVEDHLVTIQSVIKGGLLPSYGLYSLLRPAAEAAVRTAHLLDLSVSETVRLARGLNERLDNLLEQRKVGVDDGHFAERVEHLSERAEKHGIEVMWSKSGKVIGFGETLPEDRDLFSRYLAAGSAAYRFLAGHVHSKPWIQLLRERSQPTDDANIKNYDTSINVVVFSGALNAVLDLQDRNISSLLILAGYPVDVWTAFKNGRRNADA